MYITLLWSSQLIYVPVQGEVYGYGIFLIILISVCKSYTKIRLCFKIVTFYVNQTKFSILVDFYYAKKKRI